MRKRQQFRNEDEERETDGQAGASEPFAAVAASTRRM
jgi:hypothetical protein